MRDFKFRAWDEVKNQMYYSDNLPDMFFFGHDGKNKMYLSKAVWDEDDGTYYSDTISTDVMQYTGLKDRDGKEIYEGDVVEVEEYREKAGETGLHWKWYEYEVSYRDQRWLPDDLHEARTIGNIYENPELLEARVREII